jgi:predicted AAA+ superfamily ATPase
MYFSRIADHTLKRLVSAFPVVGITGPRQSGKSTLLQHQLPDYTYVTFDDQRFIDYYQDDPVGFIKQYNQRVIFDEVQYVPDIFKQLKIVVDQNRDDYGRFVVTGSSQFSYMQNISESLAGRIGLINLLPLQFAELPEIAHEQAVYRGSYPELVVRNYHERELWYASYFDTYLSKDVRALSNIGDMHDFRRFIQLLATNTASILEMSYYSRKLGVTLPTIKRWLSILEASYIIFRLPPFYENFGKRIVKSPKIYFYDTGLVTYLTGIKTFEQYNQGPMAGAIFENYLVAEILKLQQHYATHQQLYYLKTSDKREIDLIVDKGHVRDFIEIKKNSTFKPAMLKVLREFVGEQDHAYLLYQGEDLPFYANISICNYQQYLMQK